MEVKSYRDLQVWQYAMQLAEQVYAFVRQLPLKSVMPFQTNFGVQPSQYPATLQRDSVVIRKRISCIFCQWHAVRCTNCKRKWNLPFVLAWPETLLPSMNLRIPLDV